VLAARAGDPLRLKLTFEDAEKLPPGYDTPELAAFEVTGVDAVLAKYNDTGKVNVHFRCVKMGRRTLCWPGVCGLSCERVRHGGGCGWGL
jgi:hypothetical protein